jgi:hypothetical protein
LQEIAAAIQRGKKYTSGGHRCQLFVINASADIEA